MKNTRKKSNGWLLKLTAIASFCLMQFAMNNNSFGQCQPYIKIDGVMIIANSITATGITLPYWLKAGQTLAADQMVESISVLEFTVNGITLEFSQIKKVTTVETVPGGKAWKIESIAKTASLSDSHGAIFSGVGTYAFVLPTCASYICIELWGGGGGGYSGAASGGGGGGGAYGQGCFAVTPGISLTVTVGDFGNFGAPATSGGTSSVTGTGVSISAAGGAGATSATGGTGGSSITATVKIPGGNGSNGFGGSPYNGGAGGAAGGSPTSPGGLGSSGSFYSSTTNLILNSVSGFPGGGGGGLAAGTAIATKGASGKVIITW